MYLLLALNLPPDNHRDLHILIRLSLPLLLHYLVNSARKCPSYREPDSKTREQIFLLLYVETQEPKPCGSVRCVSCIMTLQSQCHHFSSGSQNLQHQKFCKGSMGPTGMIHLRLLYLRLLQVKRIGNLISLERKMKC